MPVQPLSPCRHPGCTQLLPRPGYCAEHTRHSGKALYDSTRRKQDPALAYAARIRSSADWQKLRALHRKLEPWCRDPFGEHGERLQPNQQSHHIMPLATHPELGLALENLAATCAVCHARVERMARAGIPTQHLFAKQMRGVDDVKQT